MRISVPNRVGATSPARKKAGAASPSGESFHVSDAQSPVESAPVSGTSSLAAVDSILALQEVGDAATGKKQAIKHAHDMLDMLEDIRLGLIAGCVPLSKLNRLIQMVERRRDTFQDPELSALIDEVELRARVEIAKWQMQK